MFVGYKQNNRKKDGSNPKLLDYIPSLSAEVNETPHISSIMNPHSNKNVSKTKTLNATCQQAARKQVTFRSPLNDNPEAPSI